MDRRKALATLGIALVAAACGSTPTAPGPIVDPPVQQPPPPPPPPPPTLGITRILAFGDSMTEGVVSAGLSIFALDAGAPQSYPAKLQGLLTTRYTAQTVQVFNGGRSGEKAIEGRDRLGGTMSQAKPELLLLLEGANDLNAIGGETAIDATVNALEDMVREATYRGVTVMLSTLPPQRLPKGTAFSFLEKFNNALKGMASRKGAIVVDINALLPPTMIGQDGLHPTDAGYVKMAEIFMNSIRQRYEVATSTATAQSNAVLRRHASVPDARPQAGSVPFRSPRRSAPTRDPH